MADGEDGIIDFITRTPLDGPTIQQHIRHARSLGLREALETPKTLTVVAGGPSALQAHLDGPTLALNGALDAVFNPAGIAPTYYAVCDPQALVAGFLSNPPQETIYYVASKCHPDVFRALRDRDVRLWHVSDSVPDGVASAASITLTALNLFVQLGHRRFDVWGWDCCYVDGRHHAGEQGHVGDDREIEVAGRTFQTTTTWGWEGQTAVQMLPILEFMGVDVKIHGDGLVKALRELFAQSFNALEAA